MAEPRSISFGTPAHPTISADRWLTDSRVYNLIWLGRWLERAENVARVIMAASQVAIQQGSDNPKPSSSRCTASPPPGG